MNKIKEILLSYAAAVNPTEEQKAAAEERLAICIECPEWRQGAINYCGKCGCATKGKIFSPVGIQACPLAKWTI